MSDNKKVFERVKIEAILTCKSDLHIGNGFENIYRLNGELGQKTGDQKYADICLDKDDSPYIPGSTLRGYLARQIRISNGESKYEPLLGDVRNNDNSIESQSGKLRIYDALFIKSLDSIVPVTRLVTRTAIDAITGTSKNHQLFTYKVVEQGNQFKLIIELDKPNEEDIKKTMKALSCLDGSDTSQLGKNKSLMMGRLSISDIEMNVLTENSFKDWLKSNNKIDDYYTNDKSFSIIEDKNYSSFKKIKLTLLPTSPILINDIHKVKGKSGQPDYVYMHEGGFLKIPASTLKGLIRSHSRKIILTILHTNYSTHADYIKHTKIADEMLNEIFGATNKAALIRVTDAISKHEAVVHEQTFIAVDRFTGGAADGALYMAKGAVITELPCNLLLDIKLLKIDWVLGLLLFVLRDAIEGDLNVGWGNSKGYGAFNLCAEIGTKTLTDWKSVLDEVGQNSVKHRIEALECEISKRHIIEIDEFTEKESING